MGNLKKAAIAYGWFVAFVVLTNMVVRPTVKQANVPLLKDYL